MHLKQLTAMEQVNPDTGNKKKRRHRPRGRRGRGGRGDAANQDHQQDASADGTARKLANLTLKDNGTVPCTVCMDDLLRPAHPAPKGGKGKSKAQQAAPNPAPSVQTAISFPSCNHPYCPTCLTSWILATLTDRTLAFPTTCANAACPATLSPDLLDSLARALPGLTAAHRAAYRDRHVVQVQHLAQPCPTPNCSAIIYASDRMLEQARIQPTSSNAPGAPDLPELRVQCLFCREFACLRCRLPSHKPMTCTEYAALPEEAKHHPEDFAVLRMGHVLQWKRCPGCAALVDRKDGCNFIKCACGVGFCYRCGERYKSLEPTEAMQHGQPGCGCELFDIPPDPLAAAGGDVGRLVHAPGVAVPPPVPAPAPVPPQVRAAEPVDAVPPPPIPQREPEPALPPPTQADIDLAILVVLVLPTMDALQPYALRAAIHQGTLANALRKVTSAVLESATRLATNRANLAEIHRTRNWMERDLRRHQRRLARVEHGLPPDPDDQPMGEMPQPDAEQKHADHMQQLWEAALETCTETIKLDVEDLAAAVPRAADVMDLDQVFVRRIQDYIAAKRREVAASKRPRDRAYDVEVYLTDYTWPRCPQTGLRLMPHGAERSMDMLKVPKYLWPMYEDNECHICRRQFGSPVDVATHLFETDDHEVYLCCNRPFKELRGFVQHIREVHAEDGLGRLETIVPKA
ncbi:hypothetical protein BCR44DRAFT_1422698 [Catenaria anguillulae PL171]|uniref:RBR-type E3 ubiquitin transferase n=1 Tax=Catenaria anguillulae PL171 TaxID=765915 RepID=A0A1Y2I3R8_9FUNG|nr:hypothetical protein BCR44DRAFT_1422698 [Catenaria anguillulae PL171]